MVSKAVLSLVRCLVLAKQVCVWVAQQSSWWVGCWQGEGYFLLSRPTPTSYTTLLLNDTTKHCCWLLNSEVHVTIVLLCCIAHCYPHPHWTKSTPTLESKLPQTSRICFTLEMFYGDGSSFPAIILPLRYFVSQRRAPNTPNNTFGHRCMYRSTVSKLTVQTGGALV